MKNTLQCDPALIRIHALVDRIRHDLARSQIAQAVWRQPVLGISFVRLRVAEIFFTTTNLFNLIRLVYIDHGFPALHVLGYIQAT